MHRGVSGSTAAASASPPKPERRIALGDPRCGTATPKGRSEGDSKRARFSPFRPADRPLCWPEERGRPSSRRGHSSGDLPIMAMATLRLRIGPAHQGRRMTLAEFEEADFEAGYRYELARGVLEVSDSPGETHAVIVWAILRAIANYDR